MNSQRSMQNITAEPTRIGINTNMIYQVWKRLEFVYYNGISTQEVESNRNQIEDSVWSRLYSIFSRIIKRMSFGFSQTLRHLP